MTPDEALTVVRTYGTRANLRNPAWWHIHARKIENPQANAISPLKFHDREPSQIRREPDLTTAGTAQSTGHADPNPPARSVRSFIRRGPAPILVTILRINALNTRTTPKP